MAGSALPKSVPGRRRRAGTDRRVRHANVQAVAPRPRGRQDPFGAGDTALRMFPAPTGVRLQILDLLTTEALTVAQLAQELRLHRATVQYHLAHLLGEQLITEARPVGSGKAGRPALLYQASRHGSVPGFPVRKYELLANLALRTLVSELGEPRAKEVLRAQGQEMGKSFLAQAAASDPREWSPRTFEQEFVDGAMRSFGIATKVLTRTADTLVFRCYTCPFLEAAESLSELVCDSLDLGLHEGIDQGLGGVRTERLTCLGHGDPYCEYRMTWGTKAPRARD